MMEEKWNDTLNIKLKPPVVAANLCLNESVIHWIDSCKWLINWGTKQAVGDSINNVASIQQHNSAVLFIEVQRFCCSFVWN